MEHERRQRITLGHWQPPHATTVVQRHQHRACRKTVSGGTSGAKTRGRTRRELNRLWMRIYNASGLNDGIQTTICELTEECIPAISFIRWWRIDVLSAQFLCAELSGRRRVELLRLMSQFDIKNLHSSRLVESWTEYTQDSISGT